MEGETAKPAGSASTKQVAEDQPSREEKPSRFDAWVDEAREDTERHVERHVRPVIARLGERRARHKQRHIVVRVLYSAVAFTILLLGVIMLITPGPAFVLIPAGLTLLALEFASAERLLDRALDQADAAKERAANTSKTQRILGIIATILGIAAAIAAFIYWDLERYLPF